MANSKRYNGLTREQQGLRRKKYAEWVRQRGGVGMARTDADRGAGESYVRPQKRYTRFRVNEQGYFEKIKETDRNYRYRQIRAAFGLSAG